jgi:LPS export ABC transporter protein LptC
MSPPLRKPARRRWVVLLVVLALAGAGAYYALRLRVTIPDVGTIARVDTTGMTVQNIHQSSTRNGRTEWTLDAPSATYVKAEKKILLKDMHVIFYPKQGGEVYLTARDGTVATDTQNMEARGEVVVWNEKYRLETEELTYQHDTRIIASDTRARILDSTGEIAGDTLRIDLNTNQMTMEGHVRGLMTPGEPSAK